MPQRRNEKVISHVTPNLRLPVTIRFAKLKRLRISLDDEGNVLAHAPSRMTLTDIDRFIESNAGWIIRHRAKLEKKIMLPVIPESEKRRRARIIKARAAAMLAVYDGKKPAKISVRNMSSRWGSCSSNGNISLNIHLLDVEPELFEYVLYHELSHLYHMNHSAAFWAQVAKYCPDYRTRRRELQKYKIPKKQGNDQESDE